LRWLCYTREELQLRIQYIESELQSQIQLIETLKKPLLVDEHKEGSEVDSALLAHGAEDGKVRAGDRLLRSSNPMIFRAETKAFVNSEAPVNKGGETLLVNAEWEAYYCAISIWKDSNPRLLAMATAFPELGQTALKALPAQIVIPKKESKHRSSIFH